MGKPKSRPQLGLDSAHNSDQAAGIPPEHWSRPFFQQIHCCFDDAQFAPLYQEGGRQPISPSLLACITILQYMFKVSDRVAVDNTIMRQDRRTVVGRGADWTGFDAGVLCNFRKRPIEHGWERVIFDHVLDRLRSPGLLQGRRRVRVDASKLVANVARLSRADMIQETLRVSLYRGRAKRAPHAIFAATGLNVRRMLRADSWEGGPERVVASAVLAGACAPGPMPGLR